MQDKQLMFRNAGCTIGRHLEIMFQTFGRFNLPSRSASTRASANAVTSDFADAVANASAAIVECKEFKYASESDTGAADLMLLHFQNFFDKTFSPSYSSSQITYVEAEAVELSRLRSRRKRLASTASTSLVVEHHVSKITFRFSNNIPGVLTVHWMTRDRYRWIQ